MQFFNQYKDLFAVPQGHPLPSDKLHIDHQLFIESPYLPAKTQEYSLNGKLRELKRDYQHFEHHMGQLTSLRDTPKRTSSRNGNASASTLTDIHPKHNENRPMKLPLVGRGEARRREEDDRGRRREETTDDHHEGRRRQRQEARKREGWFKQENNNILKHSELDHIFSNKLSHVYELDEIKNHNLPRPEIDLGTDERRPKQSQFAIRQKSKTRLEGKAGLEGSQESRDGRSRREKAKSNLEFRRKKLEQLLRTLW